MSLNDGGSIWRTQKAEREEFQQMIGDVLRQQSKDQTPFLPFNVLVTSYEVPFSPLPFPFFALG